MKKYIFNISVQFILLIFLTCAAHAQNNLGVGTAAPDPSAKLDVTATDKGILIPRMTTTARNAISNPAKGLMVYDSTVKAFYFNDGTTWGAVGSSASSGASLQLYVTKNTPQTTALGFDVSLPDVISFQTTNTGTLTGGNTWNTSTYTFTVGATGAGLYYIDVRLTGGATLSPHAAPMLDFGGGYDNTSIYGTGVGYPATSVSTGTTGVAPVAYTKRGVLQTIVYLAAGTSFKVRGLSSSTATGILLNGDASSRLTVVKLN